MTVSNNSDLGETVAPLRMQAFENVMRCGRLTRSKAIRQTVIAAILEGTLAGAIKLLGAKATFELVQPLVDRVLNPAIAAQLRREKPVVGYPPSMRHR